ncbi:MAG: DUF1446 domain-containing protein [Nitriliruptoraceae bacterium]|nr:DUF1446 domain-containing protein [Nitriliruptoraceae bacterium]
MAGTTNPADVQRDAEVVRIANGSGFYGDRHDAMLELVEGGPIDVLTGDYLAELTMLILWRARQRDTDRGYARSFLRQARELLRPCLDRGVRIVVNAGGLHPAGLARALHELASELGCSPAIAHVTGDDLVPRLEPLAAAGHELAHLRTGRPLAAAGAPAITANAYLGAFGIVHALAAGADVVVTGRVTDASLTVGPAAWFHGWGRDEFDRLAGATAAGHVIECGAQATGGNLGVPWPTALEDPARPALPGYPIAEIAADGTAVITKHPGTGGEVSVASVTAQLLYEIEGPRYLGPDVITRVDTVRLEQQGPDRVRLHGARGEPPPRHAKVAATLFGGWRNQATFVLSGGEVARKRALLERQVAAVIDLDAIAEVHWQVERTAHPAPATNEDATTLVTLSVTDPDPARVDRRTFADGIVGLALASYAGCTLTAPPADATPVGRYWPCLIDAEVLHELVTLPDGRTVQVAPAATVLPAGDAALAPLDTPSSAPDDPAPAGTDGDHDRVEVPLGRLVAGRSGDKGGDANIGLFVADPAHYAWLCGLVEDPASRARLLPDLPASDVEVHRFPALNAVNLVCRGLLGDGVAGSTRPDPQGKGLAEYVRARPVEVPTAWLAASDQPPAAR